MPTVPTFLPQQRLTNLPSTMSVRSSPDDFGAGLGRAVAGLGAGMQQYAEQRQLEEDHRAATAAAVEASREIDGHLFGRTDETGARTAGFLELPGEDAKGAAANYAQATKAIYESYLPKLNPRQQELFARQFAPHMESGLRSVSQHEATQIRAGQLETYKIALGASLEGAAKAFTAPDLFDERVAGARAAQAQILDLTGVRDPKARQAQLEAVDARAAGQRVELLIQNGSLEAAAAAILSDGRIAPDDRIKLKVNLGHANAAAVAAVEARARLAEHEADRAQREANKAADGWLLKIRLASDVPKAVQEFTDWARSPAAAGVAFDHLEARVGQAQALAGAVVRKEEKVDPGVEANHYVDLVTEMSSPEKIDSAIGRAADLLRDRQISLGTFKTLQATAKRQDDERVKTAMPEVLIEVKKRWDALNRQKNPADAVARYNIGTPHPEWSTGKEPIIADSRWDLTGGTAKMTREEFDQLNEHMREWIKYNPGKDATAELRRMLHPADVKIAEQALARRLLGAKPDLIKARIMRQRSRAGMLLQAGASELTVPAGQPPPDAQE